MSGLLQRAVTYTAGGLLSQGVVFALWLILPWFLPPAELGTFALAMFALELLSMLSTLGMDAALIRFAGDGRKRHGVMFAAACFNSAFAFLVVALLTVFLTNVDPAGWGTSVAWVADHLGLMLLAVCANVFWSLFQSGQIAARQARLYALYQLGRSSLYFAATLAFLLFLEPTAAAVICASAAASGILLVFALLRDGRASGRVSVQQVRSECGALRIYGVPLMLYGVMGIVVTYTQRLLVDHYADLTVLGVFAYFNTLIIQINGLWGGLNKAWTPEYFTMVDQDRDQALALMRGMLALLMIIYPAMLGLYVLLGEAFLNKMMFPMTYREHAELFYIMLLAPLYTGLYSIAYPLYYYAQRTRRILAISAFLAVVNLVLGVALISAWGATGASLSFLLLAVITALTYLVAYPEWRGDDRLGLAMMLATLLGGGGCAILLVSGEAWFFALLMGGSSALVWLLCKHLALPVLLRFIRTFRHDPISESR